MLLLRLNPLVDVVEPAARLVPVPGVRVPLMDTVALAPIVTAPAV
ncbi:hypothetical protein [Niabella hibiscisoli]|nr:hypothetical protein [Niabella hibiscisoli]